MKRHVVIIAVSLLMFPDLAVRAPAQTVLPLLRGTTDDATNPTDGTTTDTIVDGTVAGSVITPGDAPARTIAQPASTPRATPRSAPGPLPASRPTAPAIDRGRAAAVNRAATPVVDPATTGGINGRRTATENEDDNDYQPLGLRVGTFTILPSIEITAGGTDNTSRSVFGIPGGFYRIAPELIIRSDWTRHSLTFNLSGDYQGFPRSPDDDEPEVDLELRGRVDFSENSDLELVAAYGWDREARRSADVPLTASRTSNIHNLSGGLYFTHNAGMIGLRAGISGERTIYTGTVLSGGTTVDESDRNNSVADASLRLSIFPSASLVPYFEAGVLYRNYDAATDRNGYRRDAKGYRVLAGLQVDFGPKLNGTIGAGYRHEKLADGRLPDLRGPIISASLAWSPVRLTTVSLNASTAFDATTITGASGSIVHNVDINLAHSLRRNVTLDFGLGFDYRDYRGIKRRDLTTGLTAGYTWAWSRNAALIARYTYERTDSTSATAQSQTNTFELGVRLQH